MRIAINNLFSAIVLMFTISGCITDSENPKELNLTVTLLTNDPEYPWGE
jgi:hypothetical protein